MTRQLISDATWQSALRAVGGESTIGPLANFTGLLETEYVGIGDPGVDSAQPVLIACTSDLARAGVTEGSTLHIEGRVYVARLLRPDTEGMTAVVLEGP